MVIKNPYIQHCDSSTFSVLLNIYYNKKDIKLIHSIIKYPEWRSEDIDILNYVKNLDQIKNDPKTYFVFDASTEGYSPFETRFFDILYNSCKIHNIQPQKIIFVSSNMKDTENIKNYNNVKRINKSIRVFCFLSFKKMISDLIEDKFGLNFDSNTALKYYKSQTENNYKGKYGLSLSRVNREQRIFATFTLYEQGLSNKFDISQDTIKFHEARNAQRVFRLSSQKFSEWQSLLPLIVDTDDFETNHALTLNSHLHNSTLFQIVNETHTKNWNNTSLFYSEKTFRSIAHMQPFVIFGQHGCNRALEKFGFKLYHDLFDYSFDDIPNTKDRYLALLDSIKPVIQKLDGMSWEEQIDWKFSQEEILKHNFNCLMNINLEKKKFKRLIKSL